MTQAVGGLGRMCRTKKRAATKVTARSGSPRAGAPSRGLGDSVASHLPLEVYGLKLPLEVYRSLKLPLEVYQLLQHFVAGGDHSRNRLESALSGDHIRELLGQVDV